MAALRRSHRRLAELYIRWPNVEDFDEEVQTAMDDGARAVGSMRLAQETEGG
jgi:hypothetical protein